MAAQGIAVFSYEKRGTGKSGGFYTQNFELLAEDAANALAEAKRLAEGSGRRVGFLGSSQGGWGAPLAATRAKPDFVAVGFGLAVTPIQEDLDQMILEASQLGLPEGEKDNIRRLSQATARPLSSRFTSGFEELEALRAEFATKPWVDEIDGEHSGAMLRMSDPDLRRLGRALFDNLELIWDYDSGPALQELDAPLLWVIAEEDREAPPEATVETLMALKREGKDIDVWTFPGTDHGMYDFSERSDGSRRFTRVTDGYFRLLGDWITQRSAGPYGRGQGLKNEKEQTP